MFRWAIVFILIAVIAGIFGFAGITTNIEGVARVLFFIFTAMFVVSLIAGSLRADKR